VKSFYGPVLVGVGLVYVTNPAIFQRGLWKRTAISQRLLTPEQNQVYMRVLGAILIVAGMALTVVHWRE
jgi:hypothetical protein